MIRTQIYLSKEQRDALANMACLRGAHMSSLIREAVDSYLASRQGDARARKKRRDQAVIQAFGIWKDKETGFEEIRKSWDREF